MTQNNIAGFEFMDGYTEHNGKLLLQVGNPGSTEVVQEASNDHLFTEDALKQLRSMNMEYGVLHAKKKFEIQNGRVTPTFTFKMVRLMKDHITGKTEACFMNKSAFINYYSDRSVLVRKKEKMVHVPIAKAWLNWTGKRVFSLYG